MIIESIGILGINAYRFDVFFLYALIDRTWDKPNNCGWPVHVFSHLSIFSWQIFTRQMDVSISYIYEYLGIYFRLRLADSFLHRHPRSNMQYRPFCGHTRQQLYTVCHNTKDTLLSFTSIHSLDRTHSFAVETCNTFITHFWRVFLGKPAIGIDYPGWQQIYSFLGLSIFFFL